MRILVTGGSGFIGSHLIKFLIKKNHKVLNIDRLSKESINESLKKINKHKNYSFQKIDLQNYNILNKTLSEFMPQTVFNLAAESHVDRSIISPKNFVKSNINSTVNLLESVRNLLNEKNNLINNFRFIHVSTDEIYGSLKNKKNKFTENSQLDPSSPYSASKASTDLIVRAWHKTYKLPIIITNCSNNFGPWQYPEKLIPVIILNLLKKEKVPIYGNGKNIRDWIYVLDHVEGLYLVFKKGVIGENYNIGTNNEYENIEIFKKISKKITNYYKNKYNYMELLEYVSDRKGHDIRYAINNKKITSELGFRPKYNFENKLNKTIEWYLKNFKWLKNKSK